MNKFILSKVLESADATKKYIEKRRNEKTEAIYAEFMEPRKKYGFFGPVLTRTREEAIEAAKNDDDTYYRLESAAVLFEDWFSEVRKIEAAALALKDRCFTDISLSVEEFSNVAAFYKVDENV